LEVPVELDGGVAATEAENWLVVRLPEGVVPLLAVRRSGAGRVVLFNVRTFTEQDFREADEWLLAPKPLGLPSLPAALANPIRNLLLEPLGLQLTAPAGVGLYLFERGACLYNFSGQPVAATLNHQAVTLDRKGWTWLDLTRVDHE
jgi:hypothetical protein